MEALYDKFAEYGDGDTPSAHRHRVNDWVSSRNTAAGTPRPRTLNEEQTYLLPAMFWLLNYFTSFSGLASLVILSQLWLPTVQLVLQADWQVDLHSPQPVTFFSAGFAIVLIILVFSFSEIIICIFYII